MKAVRADVIFFEKMVVYQWLKFNMKRYLLRFVSNCGNQWNVWRSHLSISKSIFRTVSIWCKRSVSFVIWADEYVLVEFNSPSKQQRSIFFQIMITLFAALSGGVETYLLCNSLQHSIHDQTHCLIWHASIYRSFYKVHCKRNIFINPS